ncbi:hypothetical protein GGR46_004045 [Sphingomonas kyeonggiensis]|uniref:Uncharacterized protein n=1 Tax=Sphingomonas kyeonggiensis TaxID=1268553 RepID=A0A7W6JVT1_9SPHN|nr:hypothetical protein [Sphingomonas kyeonggiensis]
MGKLSWLGSRRAWQAPENPTRDGLLIRVVAGDVLFDAARLIASRLAGMPAIALGLIRNQVRQALDGTYDRSLELERDYRRHAGRSRFRGRRAGFCREVPTKLRGLLRASAKWSGLDRSHRVRRPFLSAFGALAVRGRDRFNDISQHQVSPAGCRDAPHVRYALDRDRREVGRAGLNRVCKTRRRSPERALCSKHLRPLSDNIAFISCGHLRHVSRASELANEGKETRRHTSS